MFMRQNIRQKGVKEGSRFWSHRISDKNDIAKVYHQSKKRKIKKNINLHKVNVRFSKDDYCIIYFNKENLYKAISENRINAYIRNKYIKRIDKINRNLLSIIPKRMTKDCYIFFNNYPKGFVFFISNNIEVYAIGCFLQDPIKTKTSLKRPIKIELLDSPIKISDHIDYHGNFYIKFNINRLSNFTETLPYLNRLISILDEK